MWHDDLIEIETSQYLSDEPINATLVTHRRHLIDFKV